MKAQSLFTTQTLPKAASLAACIPGVSRITAVDNHFITECGDRGRDMTLQELQRRDALFSAYVPGRMILGEPIPSDAVYTVVYRTTTSNEAWDTVDNIRHFSQGVDLAQWFAAYQEWTLKDGYDLSYLLFDVVDEPALLSSAFLPDLLAALERNYD